MKSIVRISGGLGNQFFQLAFGDYLNNRFKHEITFDTSFYSLVNQPDGVTHRKLVVNNIYPSGNFQDLGIFEIESNLQTLMQSNKKPLLTKLKTLHYIVKLAYTKRFVIHFRPEISFMWKALGNSLTHIFVGNWQEPDYVRGSFRKEVRINLREFVKVELPHETSRYLGIHIRRGDYMNKDSIHAVLDSTYYRKAVEIGVKVIQDPILLIFTDDIAWCKLNVNFDFPTLFANDFVKSDLEEIVLISRLEHFIIANSSFSLSGVLLGEHYKGVIAPQIWFNDGTKLKSPDYPKNWIKL